LQVTDDEATEQHEAQLASRRLHDWRVEVLEKSEDDHTRRGDAHDGQHGRYQGKETVPAHVLLGKTETTAAVFGRPPAARARPAGILVLDERARIARYTDPAAGMALLDSFDVADVTRPATLRHRDVVRTYKQTEQARTSTNIYTEQWEVKSPPENPVSRNIFADVGQNSTAWNFSKTGTHPYS